MFDKVGFYRTHDGRIVEVLIIADARLKWAFPIRGLLDGSEHSWTSSGKYDDASRPHHADLIEYLGPTKPKQKRMVTKTVEAYMNVYPNPLNNKLHASKRLADGHAANHDRIACVKLTGTYEVEEEVYE